MTHDIKAVLFDLDGTLIDTAADFVRIINATSAKNNWQTPPDVAIREQVSAGAAAMVTLMLSHNDEPTDSEQVAKFRQQFLDDYEADICVDSNLFDTFDSLLDYLEAQDVPWGIVTNKPRYLATKLLDTLELSSRCAVLVCPDDVVNSKPDPEPMYLAMDGLGLSYDKANDLLNDKAHDMADKVIYVGDHIRDIQAGNAAGMITVLASYGYIPPEDQDNLEAWQADYICDTPQALSELLQSSRFSYA